MEACERLANDRAILATTLRLAFLDIADSVFEVVDGESRAGQRLAADTRSHAAEQVSAEGRST